MFLLVPSSAEFIVSATHADIESLQRDLDDWLLYYKQERTHRGKICFGRTLLATLGDGKPTWQEKLVG